MFGLTRRLRRENDEARDRRNQRRIQPARMWKSGMAHLWVRYGHALHSLGRLQEPIRHYSRAVALSPIPAAKAALAEAYQVKLRSIYNPVRQFRFVAIGGTNICNASCIHCPTGKASTDHVPRMPMPMPMYRKLIDELASIGLPITGHLTFGLFGDALVDPHLVERVEYVRAVLPNARLALNTNGAAFNRKKHERLKEFDVNIALHCESLVPETFDYLMQPLRSVRVFPKYTEIIACFPDRVDVSVPISRLNQRELPSIRQWFMERGARSVNFDPLSSRCAEDRTLFDSLALNPSLIRCPSSVLDDLIIDADGKVLICCQDFERRESIGDLNEQSLFDILIGPRREEVSRIFDAGRHEKLATCSRCYADLR